MTSSTTPDPATASTDPAGSYDSYAILQVSLGSDGRPAADLTTVVHLEPKVNAKGDRVEPYRRIREALTTAKLPADGVYQVAALGEQMYQFNVTTVRQVEAV